MSGWRKHAPKARLIRLEWSRPYFYFASFRLANARRIQIGWLCVTVRAPWLENVARQYYPHLFAKEPSHG